LTNFLSKYTIKKNMAKAMNRSSRGCNYFRELPAGVRQYGKALNSSASSRVEMIIIVLIMQADRLYRTLYRFDIILIGRLWRGFPL
jgi:hypothetical protein